MTPTEPKMTMPCNHCQRETARVSPAGVCETCTAVVNTVQLAAMDICQWAALNDLHGAALHYDTETSETDAFITVSFTRGDPHENL
ncbi:hypothetical protein BH23ACT2_BH23ACT2_28370 [soil metagenome]